MAGPTNNRADIRNSIVKNWHPSNPNPPPSHARSPWSHQDMPNGHDVEAPLNGNGTVTPPMTDDDHEWAKEQELRQRIMQNVEENGITAPKGHKVSFHYNSQVENMHFGRTHPMKPWRLTLTKHLVLAYGLQYAMTTHEAMPATKDAVRAFHDPDYVDFLSQVSPQTFEKLCERPEFYRAIPPKHEGDNVDLGPYNLSKSPGADCPVFDGMSSYLFMYTGATLAAARQLASKESDIAINWSGGLHHAHKAEASGFCYINDIVLAILEMLKVWPRVLYIDIDVHHGDGVEEAFQRQPRVMTLSFHRYGPYDDTGHKFFPGTGDLSDTGLKGTVGEHFALNVPIPSGIDDRQYSHLFESVTGRVIASYKPSAIVLQCGADSLGGDRLGQFNLNIRQHGECLAYVQKHNLPLLVLGGGGYTARNVARAWCHETALTTQNNLPDSIPMDIVPRPEAFSGRVHGDGKLFPSFPRLHNNETKDKDIEEMIKKIEWELRYVRNAPWVVSDFLPRQDVMDGVVKRDEERRRGVGGSRKELERNPAGVGELR
ncbi:hypothetical protein MBLNU230_g7805t1 [Neophaeotheca triangularis]